MSEFICKVPAGYECKFDSIPTSEGAFIVLALILGSVAVFCAIVLIVWFFVKALDR